jgi:phosphatidate cytidylyltransferase
VLRQRVITAVVGVLALVIVIFLLPTRIALAVYAIVVLFGAWEWSALARLSNVWARTAYVAWVALLMVLASRYAGAPATYRQLLILTAIWWCIALAWLMFAPQRMSRIAAGIAGVLVLVPAWAAVSQLQVQSSQGPSLVFYVLCLVWAADIGAYFVGKRFGRLRLAPRVSPNKTWEGLAGGLAAAGLIAMIGAKIFSAPAVTFVLLSMAVAVASIVGDLTESMFKRFAGLKDSGNFIPGHGGLLDRIDSVTAALPLFVLGLVVLGGRAWSV